MTHWKRDADALGIDTDDFKRLAAENAEAVGMSSTPKTRIGSFIRWVRINRRLREEHPIRDAWRLSRRSPDGRHLL